MPAERPRTPSEEALVPILVQHYQFERLNQVPLVDDEPTARANPDEEDEALAKKKPRRLAILKKRNPLSFFSRSTRKASGSIKAIYREERFDLGLCHQSGRPEGVSTIKTTRRDGYPGCVSAYAANQASRLYRLPKNIVILILSQLSHADLFFAARTCALFRQLSVLAEFEEFHEMASHPEAVWACAIKASVEVVRRVRQSRLCARCRAQKESGHAAKLREERYLFCSGCQQTHPFAFFSQNQRALSRVARVCFGREGGIVLCAHRTVTWEDMSNDEDFRPLRWYDGTSSRIKVIRCFHPSHTQAAAGERVLQGVQPPEEKLRWPSSMPTPIPTFAIRLDWDGFSYVPTSTRRSVKVPLFDIDPSRPLAMRDIREHLLRRGMMQREDNPSCANSFVPLCPHIVLHSERSVSYLLAPFKPTRCACFGMNIELPWTGLPGSRVLYPKPSGKPGHPSYGNCLHRARVDPSMAGQFLPPDELRITGGMGASGRGAETRTLLVKHEVRCEDCHTNYSWSREGNRVFLNILCDVPVTGGKLVPLSRAWAAQIDPASYRLYEDEGLRFVDWCPDEDTGRCHKRKWRLKKASRPIDK